MTMSNNAAALLDIDNNVDDANVDYIDESWTYIIDIFDNSANYNYPGHNLAALNYTRSITFRLTSMYPMYKRPIYMLNVIDDGTIRNIFESTPINLLDLVAMANTCSRFNAIAMDIFRTKFKGEATLTAPEIVISKQVEEFVETFSTLILALRIEGFPCTWEIAQKIADLCTNIEEFCCEIEDGPSIDLMARTIVPRLTRSSIIMKNSKNYMRMFQPTDAYTITMLQTHNSTDTRLLPLITLPDLTELVIESHQQHVAEFLSINPQVQILRLHVNHHLFSIAYMLQFVPYLKELELKNISFAECLPTDWSTFAAMQELKTLRINMPLGRNGYSDNALIPSLLYGLRMGNVQLDTLILEVVTDTAELIEALHMMQCIKHLKFERLEANNLIRIVKGLHNLEVLDVEIDCGSMSTVRDTLLYCGKLRKVKIQLHDLFSATPFVFDGPLFDEISEMEQSRRIQLDVTLMAYFKRPEDIPVREVSVNWWGDVFGD